MFQGFESFRRDPWRNKCNVNRLGDKIWWPTLEMNYPTHNAIQHTNRILANWSHNNQRHRLFQPFRSYLINSLHIIGQEAPFACPQLIISQLLRQLSPLEKEKGKNHQTSIYNILHSSKNITNAHTTWIHLYLFTVWYASKNLIHTLFIRWCFHAVTPTYVQSVPTGSINAWNAAPVYSQRYLHHRQNWSADQLIGLKLWPIDMEGGVAGILSKWHPHQRKHGRGYPFRRI